jgi:hypothetical protein
MRRRFFRAAAIIIIAAVFAPAVATADPIYLSSTRRVYVELGAFGPHREIVAPDDGPFSAAVSLTSGNLGASALQTSILSPEGIFGAGVTRVDGTFSTLPLAHNLLLVNFSLATAHAYSLMAAVAGGSSGGYLAPTGSATNIFTIPVRPAADITHEGVLQPGEYEFLIEVTSNADRPQEGFQVSLQLTPTGLAPTPEPATLILLGSGGALLMARARRRRRL